MMYSIDGGAQWKIDRKQLKKLTYKNLLAKSSFCFIEFYSRKVCVIIFRGKITKLNLRYHVKFYFGVWNSNSAMSFQNLIDFFKDFFWFLKAPISSWWLSSVHAFLK